MSATDVTGSCLTVPSANPTAVFHEVFDVDGRPRPAWLHFVERLKHVSVGEFTHRSQQVAHLLDENGVTFNVFLEGKQSQRPWRLDLLPLILGAAEWDRISTALRQRVRLLDRIVADCYGPRELIRDGSLPPEALFANPGFVRPFVGLHQNSPSISLFAAELARTPDGVWRVMADRAEAPAGAAFALENRIAASRTIPPILADPSVQRLAPFFLTMQNSLKAMGRRFSDNPRIVLLSPGAKYPYYFEDVYLARYLGYTLVEGADLAVRDDRVFLKTLAGLVPIDVIISRGVERGIDPLELGGGEPHGVPGLLKVIREQKVAVANVPGCGLIESPIFMAFLPQLCRRLFDEELLMPSIATWWCGDPVQCDFVLRRLDDLVIKPAFQASGGEEIFVHQLDSTNRQKLVTQILNHPYHYVAQELVARSAVPVFRKASVGLGHAAVRAFLAYDDHDYAVMPGGLVRFAATPEPMVLSISAGEGSKDLWVLAENQVAPVSLLSDAAKPVSLRRTSAVFPSRVADDLFWFGQSLDRADFLARLLRSVIERLTAESVLDVPELPWLIRALADQGQVEPTYAIDLFSPNLPDFAEVLPRMVANVDEPRGIASAISEMDRLASLERLWMSPDTARKVREMALTFRMSIESGWSDLVDVLEALNDVILNVAAVSGLIHDGMVRGPAWRLLDMGRQLEGTRHTASLLQSLMPPEALIERPVLKALLEVIDCRMTYRARYFDNLQQNAVLDLCLTDETCPRSLVVQLESLVEHVDALPSEDRSLLRNEEKRTVMAMLHAVRMIAPEELEQAASPVLLQRLSDVERQSQTLANVLSRKYLLHSGIPRQITAELELPQ